MAGDSGGLTSAEAVLAAAATWLAAAVLVAFAWDAAGVALAPLPILAVSLAGAAAMFGWLWPRAAPRAQDMAVTVAIAVAVLVWLLRLAWPSLLPPGGGPDLTHHLILIDYIEEHRRLVHDPSAEAFLGEMAAYTPGAHLLAALGGAWIGRDGLHALYPVVALTVALKSAFVFLIALRMIPGDAHRVPLALTAVILLLLPQAYFTGSFTHDSFVAQVVSELFAVVMLWALVAWDQRPAAAPLAVFAIAGCAAFLTWPVWIGAPMATLPALIVSRRELTLAERLRGLALAAGPVLIVAGFYLQGRVAWVAIVRTSGAVLQPSIAVYGWPFMALWAAGLALALIDRRRRALVVFVFALAGQTTALLILALRSGASTPYMALKMAYLAIYAQAVAGAIAIAAAWHAARLVIAMRRIETAPEFAARGAWVIALLLACAVVPGALAYRSPAPVVTEDLARAGRWARANVPRDCVDYLVAGGDTAYWLHLAALGNPRESDRTAALDRFDGRAVVGRWVAGEAGVTYAIADMSRLPNEARDRADVLASFGAAAVLKRKGPSRCP